MDYDVVVVGARVGGAATAMLLARSGLRVLAVDQARFPSDTLSTHQIQVPGVACLRRWGLLDKIIASNALAVSESVFATGSVRLAGTYPQFEGENSIYSPRRFILDELLVDAAREAGAEVIEGFTVGGLIFEGDRVVGVRGSQKGGADREFRARVVVGADGKPFPSDRLLGTPYVMYFGFTRCADVCPTTLSRLVNLRKEAGGEKAFNIIFVTIDPTYDGPKQVGQYATLFNSPIIGLTGSPAQIAQVKKQYGIFAQPNPHPMAGTEMLHSAMVLLFDRNGKFVTTLAPSDSNADALNKLKALVG